MKYFLLFMGFPRSGHTLTAAILNANPNVYCSNQFNLFNWVEPNLDKEEFLTKIKAYSTEKYTWKQTTLIPHMPKRDIRVIGDKTGHRSVVILKEHPERLEVMKDLVGVPIKWIQVVRNPYDNIATWARLAFEAHKRSQASKNLEPEKTQHQIIDQIIHEYRDLNATIKQLRKREKEVLVVNHEFLITRMHNTLEQISNYLEIDFDPDWRENVKKTVWKKPRTTRTSIKWSRPQKDAVKRIIDKYDWLKGYEYGSCGGCRK